MIDLNSLTLYKEKISSYVDDLMPLPSPKDILILNDELIKNYSGKGLIKRGSVTLTADGVAKGFSNTSNTIATNVTSAMLKDGFEFNVKARSSIYPTLAQIFVSDTCNFEKFRFESQFQKISSGGSISYVEIPNMRHNLEALEEVVKFIYDNIQYAEFNTKSDYCHVCGYDGEIKINDDLEWECPQCGNKDHSKMNVTRRTCGYLGENFWNVGKTKEINARVMHL